MAMNMDAILRISAKVDGGTALQRLGADIAGIGTKAGSAISPLGQMRGALRGLADVAASVGLVTFGNVLFKAGDEAQRSETRISALAESYKEVDQVTSVAAKAAEKFALGNVEAQNAVTDLYGRLRPMGVSMKDIETVFFGVNKAAKQVGLSTHDTSEVLLQLSQALGSGKLQGDELRSIMERMPAVGQAVADVMGVSASEIKKLGSEGKITTEVMIRAAEELNKIAPPPPTALHQFDKALKDLRTELGENLMPLLTPFVQGITQLAQGFAGLPEPIQTAAIALGALVIAAGPIASVITGIGQALILIGPIATQVGVIWAGLQTAFIVAFQGILAFLSGTFFPTITAFFSGPAGWTVLAIAAVVGMVVAFREPIMEFLSWMRENFTQAMGQLGTLLYNVFIQPWINLWEMVKEPVIAVFDWLRGVAETVFSAIIAIGWQLFVQPWINLWDSIKEPVGDAWEAIKAYAEEGWNWIVKTTHKIFVQPWINLWENVLREPITTAWDWIKKTWKTIVTFWEDKVTKPIKDAWSWLMTSIKTAFDVGMQQVGSAFKAWVKSFVDPINWVIREVNKLVSAFNVLAEATGNPFRITPLPEIPVPAFAEGGYVRRPMLAMVGEGSQPEYIIPESKMAAASANYLAGSRGADVIPTATPSRAGSGAAPIINIRTGQVVEFDGQRYVTLQDFERGLRQVSEGVIGRLRTPAARAALGMR
jgi:tape measure domain-containing protein